MRAACSTLRTAPLPLQRPLQLSGIRQRQALQTAPPRLRTVAAAAQATAQASLLSNAEGRLQGFIASLRAAVSTTSALQQCLLGALLLLQRLVCWVQLAAVALHLQEQQLVFAGVPVGAGNVGTLLPAVAPQPQAQQPPAAAVIDFLSAAPMWAVEHVEHLRCTMTDASYGLESKMSALNRTASSFQDSLFDAAQAHSEAVRSNPEGGMWKQPCVASVLSGEEQLRQAVFEQVYAELLQKDNSDLNFRS